MFSKLQQLSQARHQHVQHGCQHSSNAALPLSRMTTGNCKPTSANSESPSMWLTKLATRTTTCHAKPPSQPSKGHSLTCHNMRVTQSTHNIYIKHQQANEHPIIATAPTDTAMPSTTQEKLSPARASMTWRSSAWHSATFHGTATCKASFK